MELGGSVSSAEWSKFVHRYRARLDGAGIADDLGTAECAAGSGAGVRGDAFEAFVYSPLDERGIRNAALARTLVYGPSAPDDGSARWSGSVQVRAPHTSHATASRRW